MTASSPYIIKEPTSISFSGGRTSGYMLYHTIEENGGLPDGSLVMFANTGKEMEATLVFINECSERWGVPIVWLEYGHRTLKDGISQDDVRPGLSCYDYTYNIVSFETASRNGEPFTRVIDDLRSMPNPISRWCSGQLKIRTMHRYLEDNGYDLPINTFLGLRGDEPKRASKLHNKVDNGQDIYCPMFVAGVTKEDVSDFWKSQPFDLQLPNNNGVTDWGNCDLCFLKGAGKRMSIIRDRPELATWWAEIEEKHSDQFDRGAPSYREMQVLATDQGNLFEFPDIETIPCFCGD